MGIDYIKHYIKIKRRDVRNYIRCKNECFHKKVDVNKKNAFIFFAADYNNLGDIAITIAQRNFLQKVLIGYEIIEVRIEETYGAINFIKKLDKDMVIITLIGGGNNGSLYEFIEAPRRCVLNELRDYKIISFPQTVIFEKKDGAKPYYKAFMNACKRCSNITLVAREQYSFNEYEMIVPGQVLLTPDIVFSLKYKQDEIQRRDDWSSFIMRNDKEKLVDSEFQNRLKRLVISQNFVIHMMDTCDVNIDEGRENILYNYLENLCKSKFAVTDRLHGMILCYITGTPCIVLENNNPKIRSTYETWLLKCENITLLSGNESEKDIIEIIKKITNSGKGDYKTILNMFNPLVNKMVSLAR